MVAVKAHDVEQALRSRPNSIALLLFYGPDSGRVSERARAAVEAAVDDPADTFQLIRLDGDDVADQPGRLVEEATTYGLFGGRRAISVRPTSRNIAAAVAACLDAPSADTLVVVEAGDLAKTSPLRALCEASSRALALPCYGDEAKDIGQVIDEALRAERLAMDSDAREFLIDSLGGDRLATRGEIAKLALYAMGQASITRQDVADIVSDVSALRLDAALDAAFRGRRSDLDDGLRQLAAHGTAPAAIMAGAIRHALSLMAAAARIEGGQDVDGALRAWRGLHFRRRDDAKRQLRAWSTSALTDAVQRLQAATLQTRQSAAMSPAIVSRALFRIADQAAGLSRR